jgi:hypothetical protein
MITLQACWNVCSRYSLDYSLLACLRAGQPSTARDRVNVRRKKLKKVRRSVTKGTASAIPLLKKAVRRTVAILVCKVLVPRVPKGDYTTASGQQNMTAYEYMDFRGAETHRAEVAGHVCPQFLVHVFQPKECTLSWGGSLAQYLTMLRT